jgi:hypothetical protein
MDFAITYRSLSGWLWHLKGFLKVALRITEPDLSPHLLIVSSCSNFFVQLDTYSVTNLLKTVNPPPHLIFLPDLLDVALVVSLSPWFCVII